MANKFKGSAAESEALHAFIALMRASARFSERVHRHLAEAELSVSEFAVLEALLHLGDLRPSEIAERILKTQGNITQVIDSLEERSLVRRKREADDRRCMKIELSSAGRKLIEQIFPRHAENLCSEMGVLNLSEQRTLRDLCRKLARGKNNNQTKGDEL